MKLARTNGVCSHRFLSCMLATLVHVAENAWRVTDSLRCCLGSGVCVCQAVNPGLCREECPCGGTVATRVILRDRCFYTFTFARAPASVPYGDIDARTCIVV